MIKTIISLTGAGRLRNHDGRPPTHGRDPDPHNAKHVD